MLNVEICSRFEKTDHDNVEKQFADYVPDLADTPVNRDVLRTIEKGRYLNQREYIDRFGYKCLLSNCSTSSKAVFLVANTDITVDLVECGDNARDYILTHFKTGSVILYTSATPINVPMPSLIDVRYRNYHFSLTNRLSYFLYHEYPSRPDLTYFLRQVQGVEVLDWKQPWRENEPEDRVVSMLLMLWAHPDTVSDPELIQALKAEMEKSNLDWDLIRSDLRDCGVNIRIPVETPLVVRQCIGKLLENGDSVVSFP